MVSIIAVYVETIAILVSKKVSSNSFKNKITFKSFLKVYRLMSHIKSNCYCYLAILKTIELCAKERAQKYPKTMY